MSYVGPLREVHDMSGPTGTPGALFGFASGGSPRSITSDAVIAQLVELFGPEAAHVRHLEIADWTTERFTSPPGAASMNSYQAYGHPIFAEPMYSGAAVWASTETSTVNPGHIEGALHAGDRAASLLLHSTASATTIPKRQS